MTQIELKDLEFNVQNSLTMKREEQIAKKARKLAIQYTKDYDDEGKEVYNIGTEVACLEMVEWVDAHPKEGLVSIEKAVKFLEQWDAYRVCLEGHKEFFIEKFRKAMKE